MPGAVYSRREGPGAHGNAGAQDPAIRDVIREHTQNHTDIVVPMKLTRNETKIVFFSIQ